MTNKVGLLYGDEVGSLLDYFSEYDTKLFMDENFK